MCTVMWAENNKIAYRPSMVFVTYIARRIPMLQKITL